MGSCPRDQAGPAGCGFLPCKGFWEPGSQLWEDGGPEDPQVRFSGVPGAVVTTTLSLPSLLPPFPFSFPRPPQVSWLGDEPVAAVWSEKGQVEVFALRRLLQVVHDPQALATFLRDEQARVKPIFAFAGHMGEGFALDWSPRVSGGCPRGAGNRPWVGQGWEGGGSVGRGGC